MIDVKFRLNQDVLQTFFGIEVESVSNVRESSNGF